MNEEVRVVGGEVVDILEGDRIGGKKLKKELEVFMRGEGKVEK